MDRILPSVILIAAALGVLALMVRSWRARGRRDAGLAAGYPLPVREAPDLASAAAFYVATTAHGVPLDRLAIRGLAFPARARLAVTEAGVIIAPAGEDTVFIPAGAIDAFDDATWTIDRAVESDGLLRLDWRLGTATGATDADARVVDSYFRIVDAGERAGVRDALRTIAADALRPAAHDESEA